MNNIFDYALTVFQLDLSRGKLALFSECLAESLYIHDRLTEDELEQYRELLEERRLWVDCGPNRADGADSGSQGILDSDG